MSNRYYSDTLQISQTLNPLGGVQFEIRRKQKDGTWASIMTFKSLHQAHKEAMLLLRKFY